MIYVIGLILVLCIIEYFREGKKNRADNKGENLFIPNQYSMIDYYDFCPDYNKKFGDDVPNDFINDFPSDFGSGFSLDV